MHNRGHIRRASFAALRLVGFVVGLALLSACGGGGGGGGGAALPIVGLPAGAAPTAPAVPTVPVSTGRVLRDSVGSKITGYNYPLEIFLPSTYDTAVEARFPVIFALDGDATNGLPQNRFANLKDVLIKRGTQAILVGIGGQVRRQEEYNYPGSVAFHRFLAEELIPQTDAKYRTQPAQRMLTGLSTSGNLALAAMLMEAPDKLQFSAFISIEGAFWQQEATLQQEEQAMFERLAGRPLPVSLVLARCQSGCNSEVVAAMAKRIAGRNYPQLRLYETRFDSTHVGTDVLAFEDAMGKLLP